MQLTQSRLGKVEPDFQRIIAQSVTKSVRNNYIRNPSLKKITREMVDDPAVAPPAYVASVKKTAEFGGLKEEIRRASPT